jgi:hypothetical protein
VDRLAGEKNFCATGNVLEAVVLELAQFIRRFVFGFIGCTALLRAEGASQQQKQR